MRKHFLNLLWVVIISVSANPVPEKSPRRIIKPEGRIIGGNDAGAGQYPFAGAIYHRTDDGTYFCGGSLISRTWILTAARCAINSVQFTVILGSTRLEGVDNNRQMFTTSLYRIHPDFDVDTDTFDSNVGLIQLYFPVTFTSYIAPIELPIIPIQNDLTVRAIGWGSKGDRDASLSNNLNNVELSVLTNDACQKLFSTPITQKTVCANGNYNEGVCRGDLGGPLIQYINVNVPFHVGIANFISENGCESTDPSGYTRTYFYVDWIRNTTNT